MRKLRIVLCLTSAALVVAAAQLSANSVSPDTQWNSVATSDGSTATARHEASAVSVGDRLFLMGGRGNKPVEVYDTINKTWVTLDRAPVDLHHFQPVAVGTDIYAMGALVSGGYPNEESEADIHVFDTVTFTWSIAGSLPENRRRGSAGAVYRDGKIYLVGGNTQGHNGGAVPWLDSYDTTTGEWQILSDAPNGRDHFAAAVVNDRLIAAGGRRSTAAQGDVFANTVAQTDVYNFSTDTWTQGADIPTMRAGIMVASAGGELLVAGGEITENTKALSTVEAYSVENNSWRSLQSMIDARHSGGAAVVGTVWHVVAGSLTRGGGASNETSNHETLELYVNPDNDYDGLSNVDEMSIYSTDPNDPDSDDDDLSDGEEVGLGSNPLAADTDSDGLDDGDEMNVYYSNPLLADSDDDGLTDDAEVLLWKSDPNVADSDGDGLNDGDEVSRRLSPTLADTDSDGLNDGAEIIAGTDPLNPDTDNDGVLDGDDATPLKGVSKSGRLSSWLIAVFGMILLGRSCVLRQ